MSEFLERAYENLLKENSAYFQRSLNAASLAGRIEAYILMEKQPDMETLAEWREEALAATYKKPSDGDKS